LKSILLFSFYEAADCVKPLRSLPSFETPQSERPSPSQGRSRIFVSHQRGKTASAVILLFVLCVAMSSPAHHDKRGVGHNLFHDHPGGRENSRAHHAI
jgi:hypothetical protein